jgi:thiol-disulfide isomerase/thioredoxin
MKTRFAGRGRKFVATFTAVFALVLLASGQKAGVAKVTAASAALQKPVITQIDAAALKQILKPKGKPLLVNFWATWCDPCREEFPDLVKIDSEYRRLGLDFVTVSLDDPPDIKTKVPKFLQEMKATMPAYLLNVSDPEPAITAVDPKWQGDLPATILYTSGGQIAFKHFGRVNPGELRLAIEKLIGSSKGQ